MRISDWSSDVCSSDLLMHDPTALFRFEEHDVFLPMMVLEELDAAKKGMSEVSRNVRSEERRVGKECVSTCRSRWSRYHEKKQQNTDHSAEETIILELRQRQTQLATLKHITRKS